MVVQVMDRLSSSASTVPSLDDYFEHNLWNPLLELIFLEQANGIFASYLVEIDLAMIALYCHFALALLCCKEGVYESARCFIGHYCPWSFFLLWHYCHPGNIVSLLWLMHSLQNFAQHIRPLAGTVHSDTVLYLSVVIVEFGGVPLHDNVSGILMLPRAGGHQLAHGPESKCS